MNQGNKFWASLVLITGDDKNKIKNIMNRSAFYIHLYLAAAYLKLKYPLYYGLPATQIYELHITIKFMEIL